MPAAEPGIFAAGGRWTWSWKCNWKAAARLCQSSLKLKDYPKPAKKNCWQAGIVLRPLLTRQDLSNYILNTVLGLEYSLAASADIPIH
jgi:hypothetical protein